MKKGLLLLTSSLMLTSVVSVAQQTPKIDSYLSQIKELKKSNCKLSLGLETTDKEEMTKKSSNWITKGNKVLIDAFASTNTESLKSELAALGVTEMEAHGNMVSGWINLDNVSKLNNCGNLSRVVPEFKPTTNVGSTTSQAVTTLFSAEASKIFDVNGEGIKIGILSDSFNARGDANTTVASGDIPGIGNPNGFTTPVQVLSEIEDLEGGIDEGRGMAELIHDIAPGAELAFYSAFNGFFDFADGIRALRAAGCDVIVDDIGYFVSPYFQDGAIAQAVDDVVADGAVYLSSAGNGSRNSYEDDYNEVDQGGLAFYDFGGGDFTQSLSVAPGQNINLWFQWDDPSIFAYSEDPFTGEDVAGPLPDTDLDVLLFDATTGDLLDSSLFFNPIDGFPIEIIDYTNETGEPVFVDILVQRLSGPAPRRLKYMDNGNGDLTFLENFTGNNKGTCYGHSNAAGTIAVGAQAYVFNSEFKDAGFGGNTATSLNSFSSYGGIPILVDLEGNDIEPIDRQKPDVVGTDFTNTSSFPDPSGDFFDLEGDGFPNFAGTSAAAPHVAAIVALMLQEKPDLTPQQVWEVLDETAIDMDDPTTEGFDTGYDIATGMGFVQGDKALAALQEEPTVYRYEAYDAITDSFMQTLTDDSVVSLETVEGGLINILGLATDGLNDVESVKFTLSGQESIVEQDSNFPFTLYGDNGKGDLNNWEATVGEYQLSASASDQKNAQGSTGNTYTIGFQVDYQALISSFILVNTDTNEDIGPLAETMDISIFKDNPNVTIRAEVGSPIANTAFAEKVIFNLSGALQRYTEDQTAPYALFGDSNGNYNSWQPSPVLGSYTIEATPHARRNGQGTAGTTTSFSFEIIDESIFTFDSELTENILSLNATSKVLSITSASEENVTFGIYNMQGATVYSGEVSSTNPSEINMSTLGSGLFIVRSNDAESINSKIYLNN